MSWPMVFHYVRIRSTIHDIRHKLSLCDQIRTDIDTHTNEVTLSAVSAPDSSQCRNIQTVETSAPSVDNSPGDVISSRCPCAAAYSMPLMTVETFPRLPGGVHAALDSLQ